MKALKIQVRTKKEESASLYHLLEAHEGLTGYRTLPHVEGSMDRDVELIYSPDAHEDLLSLLAEHPQWEILSKE